LNPAEPGDVRSVMSPTSYQAAPRLIDTTRLAALLQPHPPQVPDEYNHRRIARKSVFANEALDYDIRFSTVVNT
jgi:hypothetical protein